MSKIKKTAIITAVIMIAVGLMITFIGFFGIKFDFSKLSTVQMVHKAYTVEESFNNIYVECAEGSVCFVPSAGDRCEIICAEEEKITHTVDVVDDTLTIVRTDNRKWYECFGIYWYEEDVNITVALPKNSYEKLAVKSLSGDIEVPSDFIFSETEVHNTSGDTKILAGTVKNLTVKSTSGNIYIAEQEAENVYVKSTSGDVKVSSVCALHELNVKSVSGDIDLSFVNADNISADCTSGDVEFLDVIAANSMKVESVSGDIDLSKSDAKAINLKSVSGDVNGTLLSDKTFFTHTNSGDVAVPQSTAFETCEAVTTSGDIRITIISK